MTLGKDRAGGLSAVDTDDGASGGRVGGDPGLDRLAHEIRTPLSAIQSMAEALSHHGRPASIHGIIARRH